MSRLRACAAILFLSASAQAQSFNLDVGPNLILWPEPTSSYGAGAAQPGIWNPVPPSLTALPLVDRFGSATSVSVVTDWTSSYTYPFTGLLADDDAFTADGQALDALQTPALWTFSGLIDGSYDVYTYAWDSAGSGSLTEVSLPAVAGSEQLVGGAWVGSPHLLGITYALHQATVSGGTLVVQARSAAFGASGQVIGFQLVQTTGSSPFVSYCSGDGTATTCPCGNPGGAQEGCANSSGVGALLVGTGSGSALQDAQVFTANGLLPGQPALLFAGNNAVAGGAGTLFGDGLRCAGGGVVRLGVKVPDGTGATFWGPGLGATAGWATGDVRYLQAWYRDPVGSPCGNGFNLSNGVELTLSF